MSMKRTHLLAMLLERHNKINHKLNCDDNCLIYLFFPVSVVENNMLGKQLTVLGIDGIAKKAFS